MKKYQKSLLSISSTLMFVLSGMLFFAIIFKKVVAKWGFAVIEHNWYEQDIFWALILLSIFALGVCALLIIGGIYYLKLVKNNTSLTGSFDLFITNTILFVIAAIIEMFTLGGIIIWATIIAIIIIHILILFSIKYKDKAEKVITAPTEKLSKLTQMYAQKLINETEYNQLKNKSKRKHKKNEQDE